jgi:ADP-ribose pyrophosphatase
MKKQKPISTPRAAVGAVVIEEGRVLLVKRKYPPKQGKWAIPGGSVNLGESLQAAAERETLEETGLVIEAKKPIYTFDLIERDSNRDVVFHYVIVDLFAKYVSGDVHPADDVSDAAWFKPAEIEGLDISENTKKLLDKMGFLAGGIG